MGVAFSTAMQHLHENRVLSYRHKDGSPMHLGLIDCDNCIAPDGSISSRVQHLLRYMNTYAEYSVSSGIHILCWLDAVPPGGHKDQEWDMEYYWMPRSIPITGNCVVLPDWESPQDLRPCTEKFFRLHKARFAQAWLPPVPKQLAKQSSVLCPDEILAKLFDEPAGAKWANIYAGNWQGYYESPSDADLALLIKFAFYTGKDRGMMESMFSECPLSRIRTRGTLRKPKRWGVPKWNNLKYRKRSLDKAIAETNNVYTPRPKKVSDADLYMQVRQQLHAQREAK
jgi:putative DNA primase/helicase